MGARRKARECALQILYSIDVCTLEEKEAREFFWSQRYYSKEVLDFADELVRGTIKNLKDIDILISQYAKNWELGRMAIIDRNILRSATYEILHLNTIPTNVIINEAVELAKKYSTTESGKFVNGILDKIKEVRTNKKSRI